MGSTYVGEQDEPTKHNQPRETENINDIEGTTGFLSKRKSVKFRNKSTTNEQCLSISQSWHKRVSSNVLKRLQILETLKNGDVESSSETLPQLAKEGNVNTIQNFLQVKLSTFII